MKKFLCLPFFMLGIQGFAQPIITQHPQNQTACPEECLTFTISAVGGGLSYQWRAVHGLDTSIIEGANNDTIEYCETDVAFNGMGIFCTVTDSMGDSTNSSMAIIAIDSCLPPIADFTWQWNHLEICFYNASIRAHTVFWLFGDGTTDASNVDTICHTYASAQIYNVTLQAYNDHDVSSVQKTIDLLGVEEIETRFSVYPNPASGNMFVTSESKIDKIDLIDVLGNKVKTWNPLSSEAHLSLMGLAPGYYVLRLERDGTALNHPVLIK